MGSRILGSHPREALKSLDCFLSGKAYISGDNLTRDDIKVYAAVLVKPGNSFPNASKWYDAVSSQLAASFPGKAVGVRVSGKAAPAKEAEVVAGRSWPRPSWARRSRPRPRWEIEAETEVGSNGGDRDRGGLEGADRDRGGADRGRDGHRRSRSRLRWSPQVSVEQIGAEMVTGEAR